MKKLILSVCTLTMLTFATTTSYAQEAAPAAAAPEATAVAAAAPQETPAAEQKVAVDVNALPEGVKKALAGDEFKEWTASSAWQVKSAAAEYYVIEMKKGEETTTLKLDANGNKVG